MLGKLSVALLLIAAPTVAQDAPPSDPPEAEAEVATGPKPLPYKLKKVCRPREVVGSSIPRMVCSSKRIYLKPGEETEADKPSPEPQSQS